MIPSHIKYLIVPPYCKYTVRQLLPKFKGFVCCTNSVERLSFRLKLSSYGEARVWYIENGSLAGFDELTLGKYASDRSRDKYTMHIDKLFKSPSAKRRSHAKV